MLSKVPRDVKENLGRVIRAEAKLSKDGKSPTVEELARETGLSAQVVGDVQVAVRSGINSPDSLDAGKADDNSFEDQFALLDQTPDRSIPSTDDIVQRRIVIDALKNLGPMERQITYFIVYEGRKKNEIAGILGISPMQVTRLYSRALNQLRGKLTDPED